MGYQLSTFLISIIVVGALVGAYLLIVANGVSEYSTPNYDNTSGLYNGSFNKYEEINEISQQIQEKSNISSSNGLADIIGNIFNQGYQSIRLAGASFTAFTSMIGSATESLPLGSVGFLFKNMLIVIVLIIVFIGIFMALILKWPT